MGFYFSSKPIQQSFGWDTAGLWMGFGRAFPADGVVPSSALESFESRWPARETPCDPRQARPFRIQKTRRETKGPCDWLPVARGLATQRSSLDESN